MLCSVNRHGRLLGSREERRGLGRAVVRQAQAAGEKSLAIFVILIRQIAIFVFLLFGRKEKKMDFSIPQSSLSSHQAV